MLEGAIYTVDEVSDLLGIPRPTLYRYLREYSIPHLRRSGRISIPEDSFDRIREARDLHKEGLGTETVRRQLREGRGPDTVELDRRLDHLHETLEDLRGDLRERPTTDEVALSPTLRTILARQSLLISAMFNLTGMVEDLLLASGKPRKPLFEDLRAGLQAPSPQGSPRDRLAIPAAVPATTTPLSGTAANAAAPGPGSPVSVARSDRFGALGRRRRRGVLGLLSVLVVALCLTWAVPALIGAGGDPEPSASKPPRAAGGSSGGTPVETENPGAVPEETAPVRETTTQSSPTEGDAQVAAPVSGPQGGTEVPDVTGLSLREAARIIYGNGFEVAVIEVAAGHEEPETVIQTQPAPGTAAEPGTPMTLTISSGPPGTPSGTRSASASASARASASASATASTSSSSVSGYASASASAPASVSAGYAD